MLTSTEFPGNCITNTHILHDFAEIAYIVCTHAIPANTDNVPEATTPDKILERLRNAEKQFRQHSILVALDAEKLELFTFYRKVDVVKDQRTILNKFGYVCRLNSCIISAKSAARVLELLKPESNRIYRLFTSAVLSSIQILPKSGASTISIGSRVYLVPVISEDNLHSGSRSSCYPNWQIHRVNLQVIATGQVVLTVQSAKNAVLNQLADLENELGYKCPEPGSLLYLRPTGQIARFSGGLTGTKADLIEHLKASEASRYDQVKTALAQLAVVSRWLEQNHGSSVIELNEATRWIQVEIAVLETKDNESNATSKQMSWKSVMWPSSWIFVFQTTRTLRGLARLNATETGPLKFALDWYNGGTERNLQLARAQVSKDLKTDMDDDHLFADEIHFEDQFNPQQFGPPAFPASQTIYPTPPDAAVMHQTPGMSSVDGLAPTPAPMLHISQPDSEPFFDHEMRDIHDEPPQRIGTGFYDEDLFEEMPDDKFAATITVEEPNWDFFDAQDFESTNNVVGKLQHQEDGFGSNDARPSESVDRMITNNEEFPALESPFQQSSTKEPAHEGSILDVSPGKIESVYVNDLTFSPITINHNVFADKSQYEETDNADPVNSQPEQDDVDPQHKRLRISRRRSSIFEGIPTISKSKDNDFRYGKHGKFWFDSNPLAKAKQIPLQHTAHQQRRPSSGSDVSLASDMGSSDASSPANDHVRPLTKRTWTEYNPEITMEETSSPANIDLSQYGTDTDNVLAVIHAATGEDPFSMDIEPLRDLKRRPDYNTSKTLMIAQILVDQVSQSSLLRDEPTLQLHCKDNNLQVDVSMDHSGARTPINHATLTELSCIPPKTTPKIASLNNRLLCLNRFNVEILARQSVLPFWDVLALQPYSKSKDLTAFCVHPGGNNVSDGCIDFLNRLADTYVSCNLGGHTAGRLDGLTDDGLVPWTSQTNFGSGLKQLCQKLGSAIGQSNSFRGSTIVVYMISPTKDGACYREICNAFTVLFEAFAEYSEGNKKGTELVLQIVPLSFIASPDTLVVPSQEAYLALAFEVYNRVPVSQFDMAAASCGSAVILEKYHIRDPSFELTTTMMSPLSKDGPCLHLAYSYSMDRNWLTAAWSDERGLIAFTMSYVLGVSNGGKTHSKREVLRSIWDISHDVMNRMRMKWRLVVAHTGFYDTEDIGEWQHLVSQASDDRKLLNRLVLLSIDLNPDISIEVSSIVGRVGQQPPVAQVMNASGTPVTTPQPSITSPDQIVAATPSSGGITHPNVATPPEPNAESGGENETTLIEPTDQSWSVLLAYGLNQSSNFFDIRPAAASGFLVKRSKSKDETRALRLLGINLVTAPRAQPAALTLSERESILQEMMEQYRGLVTLAISRGCIDKGLDCVPWHVATAVKGSRVLSEAM